MAFNNNFDQKSLSVEPKSKKPKLDNDSHDDSAFSRLPDEILLKIIENVSITQWPALELVDTRFRSITITAWNALESVDLENDFIYDLKQPKNPTTETLRATEAILEKLSIQSPNVKSLNGVCFQTDNPASNATAIEHLARFEQLETIHFVARENGLRNIVLVNLVEFLESTRSRAMLKEITIDYCTIYNMPIALFERMRSAFSNVDSSNGHELIPITLEKFTFKATNPPEDALTFLSTMDGSRLTTISFGSMSIDSDVLTMFINRATQLRHVDFAFQRCSTWPCGGPYLQANKRLIASLASHPSLTSLKFNTNCIHDSGCLNFQTEFVDMLKSLGPRLELLALALYFVMPPFDMGEICGAVREHMPNLKSIELPIDKCTPADVDGLGDGKELEEIRFLTENILSPVSSNQVGAIASVIRKSPRLKHLIADSFCPDGTGVTEMCKLTDLIELRIHAGKSIQSDFVALSNAAFVRNLRVLRLTAIRGDASDGLIALIRQAKELRALDLEGHITDHYLRAVAESCQKLEKIWTSGYPYRMFWISLQLLIDKCPNLRRERRRWYLSS